MGDRCTGHCCRDLVLSATPAELSAGYDAKTGNPLRESGRIASMMQSIYVDEDGVQHYRCIHLMGCGDCAIYSSRPAMCRDHPTSGRCKSKGCTWDAVNGAEERHGH